jgi:hypothetical protein
LKFALQQITVYFGFFILITGLIGGILSVITFTTLKTFRETTCAFYLTLASIFGMGQIMTGLFVRILSDGFSVDPRKISWFCKIYFFVSGWCLAVWLTSICLATIDQFLSMSKYRHLSNLRLARRFIVIACIFWVLHGIFIFFYWDVSFGICTVINPKYALYYTHFTLPVLYGCLPIGIMITFSLLAFYRARTLASRQLNIVRLSRDRQLTAMILVHVIYIVIVLIPFTSFYIYSLNTHITDPKHSAYNALIYAITVLIEYSMAAVSIIFEKSKANKFYFSENIGRILYLLLCFGTFS